MSFLHKAPTKVLIKIKAGYSYGPRTFQYGHTDDDGVFTVDENDGWDAHLEVTCNVGGTPAFEADTQDSGGILTIDPDDIIVELMMSPDETDDLDFSCCNFTLDLYKDDFDDPTDKKPFLEGEIKVI